MKNTRKQARRTAPTKEAVTIAKEDNDYQSKQRIEVKTF
jgi:hypothetical protein